MKKSKYFKWILISLLVFFTIIVLTFVGFYGYIRIKANKYAKIALNSFPDEKEKIFAMVRYMNKGEYTLMERNHMVWAIGTLNDKRALPYLEDIYTGKPCNHSAYLCQYELAKAINKCGGKIEIPHR